MREIETINNLIITNERLVLENVKLKAELEGLRSKYGSETLDITAVCQALLECGPEPSWEELQDLYSNKK
jgi:hypothetical protein